MRKLILGILMLVPVAVSLAQPPAKNKYKKGNVLGIHLTMHDFATASDIKSNGLSNVLTKTNWKSIQSKNAGIAVSYTKGISNTLDVMTRLGGSLLYYPIPGKTNIDEKYLVEADVNLNLKLIPDNYVVVPFVSVGAGASAWGGYLSAYMPLGAGLQVKLGSESFLFLQSQYRTPVTTNNGVSNVFWGIGFAGKISK